MSQFVNPLEAQENAENLAVTEVPNPTEIGSTPDHESLSLVADRATQVFGNRQKVMRWLGIPIPALQYATPVSMLDSAEGVNAVLAVLGRIEHDVF